MGVKEGEADKESERKRVRETERGGQRKLERMRYTYKKREVCNFKNIYYINVFTTRSDLNGLSTHCFKELPDISSEDDSSNLDLLLKISWPLKSSMEWDDADAAKWTAPREVFCLFLAHA